MSISDVIELLGYPPIQRGFLVLLTAGTLFPIIGVFVLRLNLITLRFTLMHSALLGAAIALAAGWNPLITGIIINILLILGIARLGNVRGSGNLGHATTFFMVFTIGLAFAILYRYNVPANESLALLWGNIFALTSADAVITASFAGIILLWLLLLFPQLKAVLYNRDVAFTSGVDSNLVHNSILLAVGVIITLTMGLIGALLLDAILILPGIIAGITSRSTRGLFLHACLTGAFISIIGFFSALVIDIPASSGVTLTGAVLLGVVLIISQIQKRRRSSQI